MPSVISGDANVSATEFGFLDGVTSSLQSQIDSKLPLAGGKILQIVRATDSTDRSTTSTSIVDANISVTITPQFVDSGIIIIWVVSVRHPNSGFCNLYVTDSSNNVVSGGRQGFGTNTGLSDPLTSATVAGYSTPATTSAVTYKGRFAVTSGTGNLFNSTITTGQLYAIEVSA